MKKYLSFAKKIVALSLLSVPFFSCGVNAGLGPEVDVTAPIVKITSHEDNDAVASTFTLEGTASDNEKITNLKVDFESADLHFQIVPGGAWYKKVAGSSDWVAVPATEGRCVGNGTSWEWSIFVNTAEGNNTSNTGSGVPYSLTAVVEDAIGNSGKNSKVDVSLIMDENNPDVSIYKPELLPDTYATAQSAAADYELKNGNFIAKLLNGDITLSGRQDKAVSFRELRIEFDDGGLSAGTRKVTNQAYLTTEEIAENVAFDGESNVRTYYSKTLKKGVDANDLRTWEVTVPQSDWVTESKN